MSTPAGNKAAEAGVEPDVAEAQRHHIDHAADIDQKAAITDFKTDAIEAENAEFQMGVIECVKAYPMAATWAFIMSCTIVSFPQTYPIVAMFPEPVFGLFLPHN
jgi:SP family general alpha glucoside:H+ symporter-like MFS transporter